MKRLLFVLTLPPAVLLIMAFSNVSTAVKFAKTDWDASKNKALEELTSQIKNSMGMSADSVHKENFIKFLSDSRDWAFEYIEQSQKTIKEVSEELKDKGLNNYSEKLLALLPETNQEKK